MHARMCDVGQEKDAKPWARERFQALLCGMEMTDGCEEGVRAVRATTVLKCDGEAYVNKRKGKIIPGYELELEIGYEGDVGDGGAVCSGKVRFPYIADENADEDPEVNVLTSKDSKEDAAVKSSVFKTLVPKMLAGVRVFVEEMAAGGPGGDAPSAGANVDAAAQAAAKAEADSKAKKAAAAELRSDKTAPLSQKNHTIKMTENFYCRPQDICDCLLDGNRVMHFTRSAAKVSPTLGAFEMFDGNIHGETIEYAPGEKIVQKWRFRNWPEGHFSLVTITFREPEPGNCFVDLVQTNVPECDGFGNETVMDTTENGWKNLIFSRIRQVFGYGA